MANQIIDKALAHIAYHFEKTSISYAGWEATFTFRSDGTNLDVTIPLSSVRVSTTNSYSITSTTWNFVGKSSQATAVTPTVNSIIRTSRDALVVRFAQPSGISGTDYGIAINRGQITITSS